MRSRQATYKEIFICGFSHRLGAQLSLLGVNEAGPESCLSFIERKGVRLTSELGGLRSLLRLSASPMDQGIPTWLLFAAPTWIALVIAISVFHRLWTGKPIFPRIPANANFAERGALGDFASNCLLVAVTDTTLIVVPQFPFNLMFLPAIYGLERNIPLATIKVVEIVKGFLGKSVLITYGDTDRRLRLKVREPFTLENALRHRR